MTDLRREAYSGNALVGERRWTPEFTIERATGALAYAGTESGWTSLR